MFPQKPWKNALFLNIGVWMDKALPFLVFFPFSTILFSTATFSK